MITLLVIFLICFILLEFINALLKDKENEGKEKIASITIKKDGYIISHEDVYK